MYIKGRIATVPFIFDDLTGFKVRPALCLTDSTGPYHHVVLGFITTQNVYRGIQGDIILRKSHPDFKATRLPLFDSVIRLSQITTLKDDRIYKVLGILSPGWQAEVDEKLKELFGL